MSLLDAARELFDEAPVYDVQGDSVNRCNYCDEPLYDATRQPLGDHEPDCPWLAVPRILAALEAAEAYVAPGDEGGGSWARLEVLEAAMQGEA